MNRGDLRASHREILDVQAHMSPEYRGFYAVLREPPVRRPSVIEYSQEDETKINDTLTYRNFLLAASKLGRMRREIEAT